MIKVSKLEFAYRQSVKKAINGIDFNINDGEIFGGIQRGQIFIIDKQI
jgi:ABC-type dipeptide/oligopeptide/nickel transport system ATPase subunit